MRLPAQAATLLNSTARQNCLACAPTGAWREPVPALFAAPQDQGMRGSLYSRDDLMAKYGLPEGHDKDVDELPDRTEEFDGGSVGLAERLVVGGLAWMRRGRLPASRWTHAAS